MATLHTKLPLNTGAEIPAVGFGTWQDADAQEAAVAEALKAGYRHIDTARMFVSHHSPFVYTSHSQLLQLRHRARCRRSH